ncbi:hypothetical protein [Bowdeniella massiliensis]|uniref:hypothetical protein n=1 Tax=Bowdeniella massiliensis TaxID=2932264 RepID=UPI0020293B3A|nr:hypothetical protein [Bowdeniella massiliensis]
MTTVAAINVLNIPVRQELLQQWRTWSAPEVQPFFVAELPQDVREHLPRDSRGDLPIEVIDTFRLTVLAGWYFPKLNSPHFHYQCAER